MVPASRLQQRSHVTVSISLVSRPVSVPIEDDTSVKAVATTAYIIVSISLVSKLNLAPAEDDTSDDAIAKAIDDC
jgi:hypothetical protein